MAPVLKTGWVCALQSSNLCTSAIILNYMPKDKTKIDKNQIIIIGSLLVILVVGIIIAVSITNKRNNEKNQSSSSSSSIESSSSSDSNSSNSSQIKAKDEIEPPTNDRKPAVPAIPTRGDN